tara:strand:- start:185 stop:1072 length:888 start_codon:yes stop_codon:yes gene_type:complete
LSESLSIIHQNNQLQRAETVVAMAVYSEDSAEWVNQAIVSILEQTYRNFLFVIIIDGDVSDAINDVVMACARSDSRVVVAKNTTNIGLAASMNRVIDWALSVSPVFFVRMDADDISRPQRLERQIAYLNKHQNVAVIGSALDEINERGVKVGARTMPASHKKIVRMLPRRCSLNHPTVTLRFAVFEEGFRYDATLRNTQDYFLWIELAAHGYVFRNLKEKLLAFRRVNDFYKRRGLSKSINEFKARILAMKKLKRYTLWNLTYACGVLFLRLMPGKVVKLAYQLDRHLLEKFIKH